MASIGSAFTEGAVIAITIKAIDEFSGAFGKAETGMSKLGTAMKIGTAAIVAAGAAIVAVGVSSLKAAADFEQTEIAFTTMLGSAEQAQTFLSELADFAKRTPFTLTGVENSAKQLMAVGFAAEEVVPTLKSVGDVASGLGLGEEGLQRLILNLGQVRNQGKLTGRELRDFAVAGVPLLDELAKNLGKTTLEIQDMVSAGEISSDIVSQAFESMTSEGGRFANLMSKQADTVKGKFSNLQDTITLLSREIGKALIPGVSELADTLLNDVLPALTPLIEPMTNILVEILKKGSDILPRLTPLLIRLADVFLDIFDALMPIIDPLIDLSFVLLEALLDVLEPLIPDIKELAFAMVDVFKAIQPLLKPVTELIVLLLQLAGDVLIDTLVFSLRLVTPLLEFVSNVLGKIVDAVKQVIEWFGNLGGVFRDFSFGKLGDLFNITDKEIRVVQEETKEPTSSSSGSSSNSSNSSGFSNYINQPSPFQSSNQNQGYSVGNTYYPPTIRLNDFILRPDGSIIETNPEDTIYGVKGGMNGGIVVNIDRVYGIDSEDISEALQNKLNNLIRR